MDELRKRLKKELKRELLDHADKLGLGDQSDLNKDPLIEYILKNGDHEELKKRLGMAAEKPKRNWKTIGFWGSIASIIALIFVFFPVQNNIPDEDFSALMREVRKKISDPKIIQEYEQKLKETARALKEFKEADKKAREEALAAFRKGDFSKALELLEKQRKKEKQRDKEEARTAYLLGNVYYLQFKYKDALASYLEAELLDPQNWDTLNSIGLCYLKIPDYKQAEAYFKYSLELVKNGKEADSRTAASWNNLGEALREQGQYNRAIQFYQKALDIVTNAHGESHMKVAICWNNLGLAYGSQGQYDRAIQYFQKALDVFIKVHGEEHPHVAVSWNNLGTAYFSKKNYKKATTYLEKALLIFEKFLGTNHPDTRNTRSWLEDVREKLITVE